MTAAPALAFPPGRVLAGWGRQLAPLRPRALWVAHLLLHRVEALAAVARPGRLDPFARQVLSAFDLSPDVSAAGLERWLHLDRPLLDRVLHGLREHGLAGPGPDGHWRPTPMGRRAGERGEYPGRAFERRTFTFVADERPDRDPHFLALAGAEATPWPADADWHFDLRVLRDCVARPPEWKQQHGFPADVLEVVAGDEEGAAGEGAESLSPPGPPPPWQRVVVDRPERLLAVLVLAAAGGERLLGYAVRPEGWALQADAAALSLAADWAGPFPALAEEVPPERWRQAWLEWCRQRGLAAADEDVRELDRDGHRLRLHLDEGLLERLRAARSEALAGEAWLLVGSGRVRAAAQVEIAGAGASPAGGRRSG